MAVNFLLVESLLRYYMFYGHSFQIECPTGSGDYMHLGHVAEELQHRLQHLFVRDDEGRRAVNSGNEMLDFDPHWRDYLWFYEFFDGDTGRGLGASHQCGWTGLIAKMIHDTGINCRLPQTPRTPSTAAAHYFDDILTRKAHTRKSSGMSTPGLVGPRIRRSSTSRSLGNHSASNGAYVNSDDGEGNSYFGKSAAETDPFGEEAELARRRSDADEHFDAHVKQSLHRIQTGENASVFEDEFEAQLD